MHVCLCIHGLCAVWWPQRFFLGHDDDVLCTAIHPDRLTVATGQLGKAPCVMVWDATTCKQLARLPYE